MLFISDIAWIVLEMVYIGLMDGLQRRTKVFQYITAYGENFKAYFNIFIYRKKAMENSERLIDQRDWDLKYTI